MAPAVDVLLFMNEAHAHRRWRRRSKRRTLERRLARAAAQIEHSEPYQTSLRRVLELEQSFQRELSAPQRESWLALEDALLEHTERSQRAYFEAGLALGRRDREHDKAPQRGRDARLDAFSVLARLIVDLARR